MIYAHRRAAMDIHVAGARRWIFRYTQLAVKLGRHLRNLKRTLLSYIRVCVVYMYICTYACMMCNMYVCMCSIFFFASHFRIPKTERRVGALDELFVCTNATLSRRFGGKRFAYKNYRGTLYYACGRCRRDNINGTSEHESQLATALRLAKRFLGGGQGELCMYVCVCVCSCVSINAIKILRLNVEQIGLANGFGFYKHENISSAA